jgi:hypothetical protein
MFAPEDEYWTPDVGVSTTGVGSSISARKSSGAFAIQRVSAACTGGRSAAQQPREISRRGNLANPLLSTTLSRSRTNDLDWLWRRNRDNSERSRRPLGGTKAKMKR